MGLLVDILKQGSETTNDGNTAERLFNNLKQSTEITGVYVHLIKRFSITDMWI